MYKPVVQCASPGGIFPSPGPRSTWIWRPPPNPPPITRSAPAAVATSMSSAPPAARPAPQGDAHQIQYLLSPAAALLDACIRLMESRVMLWYAVHAARVNMCDAREVFTRTYHNNLSSDKLCMYWHLHKTSRTLGWCLKLITCLDRFALDDSRAHRF